MVYLQFKLCSYQMFINFYFQFITSILYLQIHLMINQQATLQLNKYSKFIITMNINIFQFLKQGTSLNRKSLNSNHQLQKQIIYEKPTPNLAFQQFGRFNQSDSEQELKPKSNKKQQIEKFNRKKQSLNAQYLKKNHIKVNGLDCPKALSNFTKIIKKYGIKKQLIKGLEDLGFHHPTPVQSQVIPCISQKRNLIVTAPTGTGKTLSYSLPIINNLMTENPININVDKKTKSKTKQSQTKNKSVNKKLRAIIMTPIQQLANQIIEQLSVLTCHLSQQNQLSFKCITKLSEQQKGKIVSGKNPGFQILITTPMSFLNLFNNQSVKKNHILKSIEYIVLDQCDKYFQQSFLQQIKAFLELFQNYHPIYTLFSATIQHPVQQLLKTQVLHDCLRIQVGGKNKVLDKIKQSIEYCTNQYGKIVFLKNMIVEGGFVPPVLIFVQQKQRAKQLYYELKKILKATVGGKQKLEVLTGEKSKQDRQQIIKNFDQGEYWALITTDLIARGIDFKNTNLVINYDFPNSMLTYIHRVGRTGRAERNGSAITLFTDQDKPVVRSLANLLKVSGCPVPQWICQLHKAKKQQIKKRQKYPIKRVSVGHSSGKDKQWEQDLQKMQKKWQKLKKRQIKKQQKIDKNNGEPIQAGNQNADDEGWIQVRGDEDQQ